MDVSKRHSRAKLACLQCDDRLWSDRSPEVAGDDLKNASADAVSNASDHQSSAAAGAGPAG